MTSAPLPRVTATAKALELIEILQKKHGELMFHQSGGCCDGSAPMCYPQGEFLVGASDRLLGQIGGALFYMSESQFDYWKHTQLIIDVVPGRGGMFSLEGPEGKRFLTRSRLFTDEEFAALQTAESDSS
ncbi:acetaldehyde dehydrogenase [Acidihalobacter ferrooxydans]|uniref:Acetaldehyde dehydrogenase n=2 Tax=Acidihalobacter ferrooxydans TaxID=1765967 RepID=A0A1P8ULD0_9GAMM|nr:acetaldehyde dehydrogenase [Acidihalobacter ferrooxydans]